MLDIKTHKIESIKAVRQFCYDTFGVTSGLKEAKDFVEIVAILQQEYALNKQVAELKVLGYTRTEVLFALDNIYRNTL